MENSTKAEIDVTNNYVSLPGGLHVPLCSSTWCSENMDKCYDKVFDRNTKTSVWKSNHNFAIKIDTIEIISTPDPDINVGICVSQVMLPGTIIRATHPELKTIDTDFQSWNVNPNDNFKLSKTSVSCIKHSIIRPPKPWYE